ncbi:MAG TPA: PH domain-containing protein [Gemmatimonadaceae bacterium]|nr:PH domain-containing protein [Gemmatimonadaceae bacterium]
MAEFPIAPATSRYLWFLVPVVLIMLGALLVLTISIRGGRASRFEVTEEGLRLRGDLYGRMIPRSQLRVEEARPVDLSREPGLRPSWRTLGTGLPGYQGGWFRLRNGEKALLYLTDRTKAVYVPTTSGYSVLLSPRDPDAFLDALRRGSS